MRPRGRRRGRLRQAARALGLLLLALLVGWRVLRAVAGTPSLEDVSWTRGVRVLDKDGALLGERPSRAGLRGRKVSLADVSPRLVAATLASEDARFFDHAGLDARAVLRAALSNVKRGRVVSGGSTLTQQLVKRIDHEGRPRPRTVAAKLVEAARAANLETVASKERILEAYFERLDYGRGHAGPEAAARGYFGVSAKDVSLAQAAFLAVLPRAPSALDPYRHEDRVVALQRELLARMRDREVISAADAARALAEPLELAPRARPRLVAPHVVLAASRGAPEDGVVRTTLDRDLQRDVEGYVAAHAARLRARGARNVAVVVVDVATSAVLAEVGTVAFGERSAGSAVDAVRARRQPGSTLKPFVYARSFEGGLSPMAMLADVPTDLGGHGASYAPENFDGTYLGPVSAREALAASLNVPAVQLAGDLGAASLVTTLRAAGLSLPEGARRYGLSIALGSGEVTPLELATAYTTLARGGSFAPLRTRAEDGSAAPVRVIAPDAVALVTDALADPLARVRGLRTRGPFELPFPVAVKTGTSSGYRDAWTAGYTRERVVVVWTGNLDGTPTDRLTGAAGAGPLFTDVIARAMRDVTRRSALLDADLLDEADVCPLSGLRAGPACTGHVHRRFAKGKAPREVCNAHVFATREAHGFRCAAPGTPPGGAERVVLLDDRFARWFAGRPTEGERDGVLPSLLARTTPGCAERALRAVPRLVVVAPRDGSVLRAAAPGAPTAAADAVEIEVLAEGLPARTELEVLVDGRVATRIAPPYRTRLPVGRGDHQVEVRPAAHALPAELGRATFAVR